jgi:hypothetical protein
MNLNKHVYYDVGDHPPFRLSAKKCQDFLLALVASQARVCDSISFSFDRDGKLITGYKPGFADACFRISIPAGNEVVFDSYMGGNFRTLPPVVGIN